MPNRAADRGAALALNPPAELVSWGIVVADFNADGRDDLFVTQGELNRRDPAQARAHYNALLLQGEDGRFASHSEEIGIPPFQERGGAIDSARAALPADLDGDGSLDLLITALDGPPALLREIPQRAHRPTRCTLRPRPSVVPSWGYGYKVQAADGQRQRSGIQGQVRSGLSPWIVTSTRRGQLIFPSGAAIPFDCGDAASIQVIEPAWLTAAWADGSWTVRLDPAVVMVEHVETWLQTDGRWQEAAHQTVAGVVRVQAPDDAYLMLRLNGRWIDRVFRR